LIRFTTHFAALKTDKDYFADEVGTLKLTQEIKQSVKAGDVGYLITGIKDAREVKVGDTITDAAKPTQNAIEGFEDVKPMVFAGIYPVDTDEFEELRSDTPLIVNNPTDLPDPSSIDRVEEPYIKATIITKSDFVGNVMSLCIEKRGQITNQTYLTTERVELNFDMPLAEIVFDFYDRLKTVSKGYASFDYTPIGMRKSKLVRVDILLNSQPVDALSALIHADNAVTIGKKMCEKLKELIPRQQFDIPIQAAIGAKIISRETTKALRKDVTAKCYGGDISRKRKLLEKQKKGKKRMRQVGNVEVPQEA